MFERTVRSGWVSTLLVLALTLGWTSLALASGADAVAWLKTQQNADGGFGSPQSSVGGTADVLLAAAAAGDNATGWAREGKTSLAYLEANVGSVAKAGDTAKVILALIASGKNPRDLAGTDLVAKLEGTIGANGKIGTDAEFINEHCYAILALASARRPIPASAVDYLRNSQIEDGTWSWNGDTTPGSGDNNTAAMAVLALRAAGVPASDAQIQKTLAHFKAQQNEDGGFPYINPSPYGTASDANSTAVVIWAILAAGQDPAGVDWKYQGQDGHSALDRLRSFQNSNGAFRWQDSMAADNLAATVQAVVAVELETLPFASMDVGAPATPAQPAQVILPVTGADLLVPALALLGAGAALAAAGWGVRSRR